MPRRLFAIVIAFVLSCYGFAALAHGVPSHQAGAFKACLQTLASESNAPAQRVAAVDGPTSTTGEPAGHSGGELPGQGEVGADFAEMVDAGHRAASPVMLPAAPAGVDLAAGPQPVPERPKRPPRAALAAV